MNFKTIFWILVFFAFLNPVLAVKKLDSSLCFSNEAGALAQINSCYNSCQIQGQSYLIKYQDEKKRLDTWYDHLALNCPSYSICEQNCRIQEKDSLSCLKERCFSLSKDCEDKRLIFQKEVANDYYSYMSCFCKNCIIPTCRYLRSPDCSEKVSSCDKARLDSIGAKYSHSVKSFIGCNSSNAVSTTLTQIGINSIKNAKKKNSPNISPQTSPVPTTNLKKKTTTKLNSKLKDIAQKNKLQVIETKDKNGENVKIVVPKVKVDKDKQPGLFFKTKMHIQNNAVNNVFDNTLGKIPLIKYFKNYIIDDVVNIHKSDETKIKETQVTLNVDKNAAKQYNDMSGIEAKEKELSPLTNAIPTNVVTEPFDYVIKQMGTGIKKCVAHGYEKEYEIAKEHAKLLRKSGLTWSQTIAQTSKLTGEDTGGYRYVQTLNAQSKGDFKLQGARIKNYIYHMRDTGELK